VKKKFFGVTYATARSKLTEALTTKHWFSGIWLPVSLADTADQ